MCQFFEKPSYPVSVIQTGHHRAQLVDWQSSLQMSQKENSDRITFTLRFHPYNHLVKSIILKNFKLLQNNPKTDTIFSRPAQLISFERHKNTGEFLVRSSFQTNNQPGTFLKVHSRTMQNLSFIHNAEKILGPKRSIKIIDHFTCTSANVICCITCKVARKAA